MVSHDSPLEHQRAHVAKLRAELDRQSLILEGMERMAAFVAPTAQGLARRERGSKAEAGSASRGRQPGAISQRWRHVFRSLVLGGNRFNDEHVVGTVRRLEGREIRRSEVRRLFENHRANGLVAFHEDGTYSVTDHAIEKFDLGRNEEGPAVQPAEPSAGRVAELEEPASSEQHPFRKGENVGSSPTPPSPFTRPWEASTSPSAFTSTPNPPWKV